MSEFQVQKSNFSQTKIVSTEKPEIGAGETLLKIDHFGFTANNVTYAVAGDTLKYWNFFPASGNESSDTEMGIIPVWGFADVVESNADELPVGDRLFGYFPPAEYLIIEPDNVKSHSVVDNSEHRRELPPLYNRYQRVLSDPSYNPKLDAARMLLGPLQLTSYCLWDAMQDNDWYGAKQVIVASASSKTSLGLAIALSDDDNAPKSIGLTSANNKAFVESLGYYDQVIAYEDVEVELGDAATPTVIVDMSGNLGLIATLHGYFGDAMQKTLKVGLTHWDELNNSDAKQNINNERSEFFFAPGHVQKRYKDWGPGEFDKRSRGFMQKAATETMAWMDINLLDGLTELEGIYDDVCNGKVSPKTGIVVKL